MIPTHILSQDPRLERHWIYRLESDASGHLRCINEFAGHCGSPTISIADLADYYVIPLSATTYTQLAEYYSKSTDADLEAAQALIQEILKTIPNTPALCWETWLGSKAAEQAAILPPLGPGFAPAIAQRTTQLECWITTFDQPEDFVEFRAWEGTTPLATRRFRGY